MFRNPLDKAAAGLIGALLLGIAIILVRGDQVGVQIIRQAPANQASGVSTRSQLAFTFSEPMPAAALQGHIEITPALSGTVRWNGSTAFFVPAQPLQSDTRYTVTIKAGAASERGRPVLRDVHWSFTTGHARVVYLSPATSIGNLYVSDVGPSAAARRITDEPRGVFDFAVSPDGRRIVYSAVRDDTGARDLWAIHPDGSGRERIVACDGQVCQSPSFSADGARIAFERRTLVKGTLGTTPGPARLWIYDFTSGSAAPLLSDSQALGNLPRWAPVGEKLSYYDPVAGAITVIDTVTGDRVQMPSVLGDSGTWSPNGEQLIYPELKALDNGQFDQLLRADLVTNVITAVMPLSSTNDSSVNWSPLGTLIAFTRQHYSAVGAAGGVMPFGPQVWVASPEGQSAHALTDDLGYGYGGLAWSPDGQWIVAVRNNLQTTDPKPEVWLLRWDGSQVAKLAEDATIPAWLP